MYMRELNLIIYLCYFIEFRFKFQMSNSKVAFFKRNTKKWKDEELKSN